MRIRTLHLIITLAFITGVLSACIPAQEPPEEALLKDSLPDTVKKDTVVIPKLNEKDSILYYRIHYFIQDFKVSRFDYERLVDMVTVNLMVAEDIKRQYFEGGYGPELDKKMEEMERHIKDQAEILENDMEESVHDKDIRKIYRKMMRKCEKFSIQPEEKKSKG